MMNTKFEIKMCRFIGMITGALCLAAALTIDIFLIASWYTGLIPLEIGYVAGSVLLFIMGRIPILFWYTFYCSMIEDEVDVIFPEFRNMVD